MRVSVHLFDFHIVGSLLIHDFFSLPVVLLLFFLILLAELVAYYMRWS